MHSTRLLDLLVLGLSALSLAEATLVDARLAGQNGVAIQQRQTDDNSLTAQSVTSPAGPTTSSTSPTRTTRSTTPTPTTTTGRTSSSTAPPTSTPPDTTPTPTSSSSSSADDATSSESLQTVTHITTTTNSDGAVTVITSQSTNTATPGLVNNGNSSSSGMSPQTRNTVIGVVVGVGGAIVLAGLAFVAWRIWGRKRAPEENDGLMDYNSAAEKPDTGNSMSGRTPFQSTLESYHAPTQVNTASNF